MAHPKDQGLIKLLRIEQIKYALKNQIKPIQQQQTIESITTIRNEILIHNTWPVRVLEDYKPTSKN